jgi:hypothetical protein
VLRCVLVQVLLSNSVLAGRLRTTGGDPAAMPGGPECRMFVMCNNAGASFRCEWPRVGGRCVFKEHEQTASLIRSLRTTVNT